MNWTSHRAHKRHHALPLAVLALLLSALSAGCCGAAQPLQRHAELTWELRERMPQWGPLEWNAWEASLAAALDKPQPQPPLFPEAQPKEDEAHSGNESGRTDEQRHQDEDALTLRRQQEHEEVRHERR